MLLEDIIRKILKDVDPDIGKAMLTIEKIHGTEYAGWQLLHDPANTILNWQLLRDRARYKDYPMVYGGAVNNSP